MSIKESNKIYGKLLDKFSNMLSTKELIRPSSDIAVIEKFKNYRMTTSVSSTGETTIWGIFAYGEKKILCIIERVNSEKEKVSIFRKEDSGDLEYINSIEQKITSSISSNSCTLVWHYSGKIYTTVSHPTSTSEHICYDIQTNTFSTHDVIKKLNADNEKVYKYGNRILCFKYEYDAGSSYTAPASLYVRVYDLNVSNLVGGRMKIIGSKLGSIWAANSDEFGKFAITFLHHNSNSTYGNDFNSGVTSFDVSTCTTEGKSLYIGEEDYSFLSIMYDYKVIACTLENYTKKAYIYDTNTWTKTDITNNLSIYGGEGGLKNLVNAEAEYQTMSIADTFGISRYWIKVMYRNKKCVLDVKYGYLMAIDYSLLKKVCAGTVLGVIYDKDEPNKAYVYMFDTKDNLMYQVFDTWA